MQMKGQFIKACNYQTYVLSTQKIVLTMCMILALNCRDYGKYYKNSPFFLNIS